MDVAWTFMRSSTASHCAVPIKRTGVARLLMFLLTKQKITRPKNIDVFENNPNTQLDLEIVNKIFGFAAETV